MDTRAELLIDELSTHPVREPVDFSYWRERFQLLFKERMDENSRVALLTAYAALLNLVERSLVAQGNDKAAFNDARRLDWNHLCLQEALHRSETELFQPADLDEIVRREVSAGRMNHSDFAQFSAAGAAVFGEAPKVDDTKKGFFRRILG